MIDYNQKFRLDGKTAYVVGGVGLIGREVSTAFALAGTDTIILDIDQTKGEVLVNELSGTGLKVSFRDFDCSDMENLESSFSDVHDEFGTPDVFINCSYPRTDEWGESSFREVTLKSFRENIDMHMNSYAWLARLAAEAMKAKEVGGSIIQLGSIYGILGQDLTVYEGTKMHENMTYATIKGGITNMTRQMASYYGQYNIRVNTLVPGGLSGHVAGKSDTQNSIFVKQYSQKTPLKRLGRAEEIASAALFLAADAASYVTGTTLMVDGGWTVV
ncbi:MAG: SDR family oxidoreductase [Candidatus Marinimicrobia bacterium]|jgi:NAD(P)-dependent dehydrogenase (short-subunit alcohol dehydrogenase family)|nr:SDR family oxidoreductase [Candidatus Neomarinimicrobiota bacterium]